MKNYNSLEVDSYRIYEDRLIFITFKDGIRGFGTFIRENNKILVNYFWIKS